MPQTAHHASPDRTAWFRQGRIGAFMHFLPSADDRQSAERLDVTRLAEQLAQAGVSHFCFTLGQNSGRFNAPNPVYDRLTGYRPGERTSERDLPAELADALSRHGIRLMLYLPCQTPNCDLQAVTRLGFPQEPLHGDRPFSADVAWRNWAQVIQHWAERYGRAVSGWWFDGGYAHLGFCARIADAYAQAVRAGNPDAIVTFNPGVSL
ncbi:MAG: hypothetical protein ACI4WT_02385 [Oligosphaeraceae bacterium]